MTTDSQALGTLFWLHLLRTGLRQSCCISRCSQRFKLFPGWDAMKAAIICFRSTAAALSFAL